jgi:hypothetical protein
MDLMILPIMKLLREWELIFQIILKPWLSCLLWLVNNYRWIIWLVRYVRISKGTVFKNEVKGEMTCGGIVLKLHAHTWSASNYSLGQNEAQLEGEISSSWLWRFLTNNWYNWDKGYDGCLVKENVQSWIWFCLQQNRTARYHKLKLS